MRRRVGQQSIRGAIRGRPGARAGASAVAVCLGAVTLAACGGGGGSGAGGGYVAVQRPASSSAGAVAPTGDVELVPLESPSSSKGAASGPSSGSAAPGGTRSGGGDGGDTSGGPTGGGGDVGSSASGSAGAAVRDSGRTSPPSAGGDGTGATGGADVPAGPAALVVGEPEREPADKRWCEKVTLGFHNTGGTAVRSGTVTFGTHIIGALGIDWATVESAERLPVPIAPGSRTEETWTVCVDAWRVPVGMHVETRDVSVRWE
ncbi:hypothetical protein OG288_21160 [Streptomyces tauricus]|uniref:Secreted protein n=1 Tax=Streptomyces tauricus TaxID=68274 RepID=A0ABZ1JJV0_9ACTN|nr:hypothetical protein [Streptomyces tauricus]